MSGQRRAFCPRGLRRGGSAARPAMHSHSHSPLRWAVKTALFWTAVALVVAPVVGRIIDEQGK